MKKALLIIFFSLLNYASFSQVLYEEIKSDKLGSSRRVKVQLPRNYHENTQKKYPIILVLDGDYLFEPVAGNVDYSSYWEDMPESIVVGVLQSQSRFTDCAFDDSTYFPNDEGSKFFEFLGMELIPYLDEKYRTAKFIVAVGHDFTANFINYYLFKSPVLINGYINLGPDFAPMMVDRIAERIPSISEKIFYYLATGTEDVKAIHTSAALLDSRLRGIKSNNFKYYYDDFAGANHYSLVGRAIPNAFDKIFAMYRPISKQEYTDVLLKMETPISKYLVDKYAVIKDLFGITNNIRVSDFVATATAAEKKKEWESLNEIANLAQKQYPETMLGAYYLGRYYEETGNPKKAMKTYNGAYNKKEIDFITTDIMMDRADKLKNNFGY